MPAPKPLSKEDILRAMRFTKSNRAAARYLGVSYQHYKPWAKQYKVNDGDIDSPSLFEICLLYTSPSPRDRQKSRMPSSA